MTQNIKCLNITTRPI